MFESWNHTKRIEAAKRVTKRLVDHAHYLLDIHESNAITLYSDTLSKQIPTSHAANAFNTFQEAMHQIEIVRLCALWDSPHPDNETIPTVIAFIDDQKIVEALANETRAHHASIPTRIYEGKNETAEMRDLISKAMQQNDIDFGNQQAANAIEALQDAIKKSLEITSSPLLATVRNLRNKHVAHYITETRAEKVGPIAPMKYGDETRLLKATIPIVEALYCWVNGISLSFDDSKETDRKNAEALWHTCTFKIEH